MPAFDPTKIKQPPSPALPSEEAIHQTVLALTSLVTVNFQKMMVHRVAAIAVGRILSRMTFDGKQTSAQVQAIIAEEAKAAHDELKLEALRSTVGLVN